MYAAARYFGLVRLLVSHVVIVQRVEEINEIKRQ